MKGFIVLVIILFVVMVLAEMQMPKRFDWDTSYGHLDNQPFGCAVFDSVMMATATKGYAVTDSSLYKISSDDNRTQTHTYLVVRDYLSLSSYGYYYDEEEDEDLDLKSIQNLLSKGNHVVLAVREIYDNDGKESGYKKLGFRYHGRIHEHTNFYISRLKSFADTICDTVTWNAGNGYARRNFYFPIAWGENAIEVRPNVGAQVLAFDKYWYTTYDYDDNGISNDTVVESCDTLAVVIPHGKAKLVVTSMQLLFTNYGILDSEMSQLGMRILSQVADKPIVRIDPNYFHEKVINGGDSRSPLRYLLDNPPLRWALYLTFFVVLLFLVFTARRRQRVIPVIKRPDDQAMELVRHIGTLYYERHDNADLLQKKYQYFTEQLRREAVVDIDDSDHLDTELFTLAQLTGIKPDQLRTDVGQLQAAIQAERISDEQLKYFINLMNDITGRL
ncbi:MAG: DUF4350 domain-containing protein [Muribaculaceae bacterium]|nr:DUF4350 domain-containing protein [Muribaculaceae bacterium]